MSKGSYGNLLLFFLLCCTGGMFCCGIERYVERPAAQSFRDPHTGRSLPPRLGLFNKKEARVNRNPVLGSAVVYVPEKDPGSTAGIYLYALSERPEKITQEILREHAEFARQALLKQFLGNKRITRIKFIPDTFSPGEKRLSRVGTFMFTLSGKRLSTGLFMKVVRDRFIVKILLTSPADDPVMERAAAEFIREAGKLFLSPSKPQNKNKVPRNGK